MTFQENETIYEAVASYFKKMIRHGVFKPGDALPSIREVAFQEKINPNTVVRGYAILVDEGYAVSIPKKGYFVSTEEVGHRELREILHSLMKDGYSKNDIINELNNIEGGKEHD